MSQRKRKRKNHHTKCVRRKGTGMRLDSSGNRHTTNCISVYLEIIRLMKTRARTTFQLQMQSDSTTSGKRESFEAEEEEEKKWIVNLLYNVIVEPRRLFA